jgi:hypothetical protein
MFEENGFDEHANWEEVKERIEGSNAKWYKVIAYKYSEVFPKEKQENNEEKEKENQSLFDDKTVLNIAYLVVSLQGKQKEFIPFLVAKLNGVLSSDIKALAKEVFDFATSNFTNSFKDFFCSPFFSNKQLFHFLFSILI